MSQQLLGVIGYPLRHSISPAFQQAALEHCSLDICYQVWETPPERLNEKISWLRNAHGVLGANVTVPHKEAIHSLVDEMDEEARHLGAVNTVLIRNGCVIGYNTDGRGFLRALQQDGQFDPQGKNALVLGAGGAARSVVLALAKKGIKSIQIANRTLDRAEELARVVKSHGHPAQPVALEPVALAAAGRRRIWDLIVNCTTVGMRHGSAEGQTPLPKSLIPVGALVYDLVYNPMDTMLLQDARKAGARTLNGLPMLVYQGAESFSLWTGKDAPVEVMLKAAKVAMGSLA